jgi:ATP-dependent DNA helicase RecG
VLGGARQDLYEYPPLALREAIANAVTHRDYSYDSSHIYIHIYSDRIEIENPGGLFRGITVDQLGQRSVRRNRLIADLLHRARYIERVGSGFDRMRKALEDNNNPPLEVSATNFFNIRFLPRLEPLNASSMTSRQIQIYRMVETLGKLTKNEVTVAMRISDDTALRELRKLVDLELIQKEGVGKATFYSLKRNPRQ